MSAGSHLVLTHIKWSIMCLKKKKKNITDIAKIVKKRKSLTSLNKKNCFAKKILHGENIQNSYVFYKFSLMFINSLLPPYWFYNTTHKSNLSSLRSICLFCIPVRLGGYFYICLYLIMREASFVCNSIYCTSLWILVLRYFQIAPPPYALVNLNPSLSHPDQYVFKSI